MIRKILTLTMLCMATMLPASAKDFSPAGITDAHGAEAFLGRLQTAVKKNDRAAVAAMMGYPLRVNGSTPTSIRDRAAFLKRYDRVFTPSVKSALAHQRVANLFVRDQGVMIGGGQIWYNQVSGKFVVIAVNP